MTTPTDSDYPEDPAALGKMLAEEHLFGALDDLGDGARDALQTHFDMEEGGEPLWADLTPEQQAKWESTLAAYQERMTQLLDLITPILRDA